MALMAVEQAQAAVLGGLACVLPTAAFAACATHCRKPALVLLMGAAKPMAVIGLMVLAFVLANPAPLGFLVALAAVHLSYLAAPLLERGSGQRGWGQRGKKTGRGSKADETNKGITSG